MLNANKVTDIKEISKYGKAKGFLLAKRYNLPTFSNFFIIENEDEVQALLDTYKNQNDFCMRSDAKIGDAPIGVGGQNGNRKTIFDFIKKVREKSNELGSSGVAIIYWNEGDFCPTYKIEGTFYLDYRTQKELLIDYIGKGWDGSYLSHGSACHETYAIPWEDILFLNDNNIKKYRRQVVSQSVYEDLRTIRINELVKCGVSREVAEKSIPCVYNGINNEYFRQVINRVVVPMYDSRELQRYYKEYIPIVQIENGKVIVPEVILPERLKKREYLMKKDNIEFFDIVNEKDEVVGKISENRQNTIKPSQLRFINIIITNNDRKIVVPKRSSNRRIFPNCYDFSVGGHVNSGEEYEEAAYRELKEELGITNVKLLEVAYFSPYDSNSKTFQKVYILKYNNEITNYDQDGIEKLYYMTKEEVKKLMNNKPNLFKTDYFVVMKYLMDKNYL